MEQYLAKAISSFGQTFHLMKGEEFVGMLSYKKWYSFNAQIELASGSKYDLEQTGLFGTNIVLKDGETVLINCHMNWKGQIIIESFFNDMLVRYMLKNMYLINDKIVLLNSDEKELMTMIPDNKWFETNRCVDLVLSEELGTLPNKELFLLTALHCTNNLLTEGL
jgi:hypothetical protein